MYVCALVATSVFELEGQQQRLKVSLTEASARTHCRSDERRATGLGRSSALERATPHAELHTRRAGRTGRVRAECETELLIAALVHGRSAHGNGLIYADRSGRRTAAEDITQSKTERKCT
jgi:hypothetical protein